LTSPRTAEANRLSCRAASSSIGANISAAEMWIHGLHAPAGTASRLFSPVPWDGVGSRHRQNI